MNLDLILPNEKKLKKYYFQWLKTVQRLLNKLIENHKKHEKLGLLN